MNAEYRHLESGCRQQFHRPARLFLLKKDWQKDALPCPEDLIRLVDAVARTQDRSAFARLFAHFAPRVKSFLVRSGLADGVAEEVTQEVMVAVWRKASGFDPGRAGVATWVFTIARNRRIDRLRRTRAREADHVVDPSDEPDMPPSGEAIALTAEREEEVRKALKVLPDEQATVVRLSFFAEKPHPEIARELGIPLGTVKSRLRLALSRLRTLLDGDR